MHGLVFLQVDQNDQFFSRAGVIPDHPDNISGVDVKRLQSAGVGKGRVCFQEPVQSADVIHLVVG